MCFSMHSSTPLVWFTRGTPGWRARRTTQALSYFLIPVTQGFCDAGEFTFAGRHGPWPHK